MAFAALLSLEHTIKGIADSSHISATREMIMSTIEHTWSLQCTLERCREGVRVMDERIIIEEARKLEDALEFPISTHFLVDGCSTTFSFNLDQLTQKYVTTRGVLESMPKLMQLKIQIDLAPGAAETVSFFHHVSYLHELESFKSVIMNPTLLRPPPPLSVSTSFVKKLCLSGFGYPWEELSNIAKLPYLLVLKMKCYAFRGEKWDAKEMRFWSLRYLVIEDSDLVQWTAEHRNFPQLWHLTMKNCHKLQQIPQISSMGSVELVDCNPLAEACAKQRYYAESVIANYSWKDKKLKS